MKIYVIVGGGATKKSGTVRCLTGVYHRGIYKIKIKRLKKPVEIYVQVRSLQEAYINPKKFIDEINGQNIDRVIVCLREMQMNNFPSADDYIKAFRRAGWEIVKEVRLNQSGNNRGRMLYVPNTRNMPSNEIAAAVRDHFGWI